MLSQLIQQYEDGNKTRFAKRLGLSPQGISTWLSRGTIDYELVYAKCEGLNAAWLLTGEGSMLHTDSVQRSVEPALVSASSDAVVLRLMDKLDDKEAENKQLQSELRQKSEELAVLKSKHELHPEPLKRAPKSSDPAKPAFTKQPSSLTVDNATSAIVP